MGRDGDGGSDGDDMRILLTLVVFTVPWMDTLEVHSSPFLN
jgi:hypothetical protein